MVKETDVSTLRSAPVLRRARQCERTGVKMKLNRPKASVSDRTTSRLMRLGVLVLVTGVAAFGVIYYQDQHVNAGPSLVGRQIEGAEAAVKKAPLDIGIRLQLANAYLTDKRPDDALKQYDEILRADKGNRPALLGRGATLMATDDLNGAVAAYQKITGASQKGEFAGADPQLQEAHYYLGVIALKQNQTKVAGSCRPGGASPTPSSPWPMESSPMRPRSPTPPRWRTSVTRSQPMPSASSRH